MEQHRALATRKADLETQLDCTEVHRSGHIDRQRAVAGLD